jgi:DNA polymerase-3 subunit epsilon
VEKVAEDIAIETLINYIGNSILIGHRIDFDIEMLNYALSRLKLGKVKNEVYDIEAMFNKIADTNEKKYALEEMSKSLNMAISNRNSVADDAYSIAILFLKLKSKLGIK